ncbi:Proline iminopeptidase [Thiorhodovibrio winogradskyi]|uniref:Proline iminopeptidase n=1 Tax=Thiorhodovibrio winogradskyi TaxID=77007 RepID=A0ABZ0S7N2_9GAMM|nr:proline iminopeptidase-family hydrolase [Thiorhodovibrio winogradskyi]
MTTNATTGQTARAITERLLEERRVAVEHGNHVWTCCIGGGAERERTPLLILHGGPGLPHDYLRNLDALASERQRVIFYDQLGCGRSDQPDEPERWQLPRFVAEIDLVRAALGLERVVILGQSWGGMLAIEYALTRPAGLDGLVLANSTASAPLWGEETHRLRTQLDADVCAVLDQHEAAGSTHHPDYQKAVLAFYRRHLLRLEPWPAVIQRALMEIGQPYTVMWGANEFYITGNLKDWDRTPMLQEIQCPTLLISGEFDESTPRINQAMLDKLPHAEWQLLKGCSHLAHIEAPTAFQQAVITFLDQLA